MNIKKSVGLKCPANDRQNRTKTNVQRFMKNLAVKGEELS